MYVDKCTACANGKTYTRYLLRESRREGIKTIKTTIFNITHCEPPSQCGYPNTHWSDRLLAAEVVKPDHAFPHIA